MSGCEAISKSRTALEASSFPSVFKEGWLRLSKKVPFLSGADRVVSKRSRSLLICPRSAPYLFEFTNHPVCAAKERDLLLMAQPPLLENGGEWGRLATNPIPIFRDYAFGGEGMSSTEQNKENVRAFYDLAFNQKQPEEAVKRYIGSYYRQHMQ